MSPFSNPIIGDEELIRSAIKSQDFDPGSESNPVAGWRIARDGTATFNNVIIGSPNYVIDSDGNAVFKSINADTILLDGTSLSELLEDFAVGIIALTQITGSSTGYTGTSLLAGRIVIPNASANRQYVIGGSRLHFNSGTATTIDRMNLEIRINWNAPTTTASTLLWSHQERVTNTVAFDQDINFHHPFQVSPPNGEGVDDLHIGVYFYSEDTSGQLSMDGVTGSRLYVEDIGLAIEYSTFNLGTGTTPVQTYVKTYSANWSESFQSDGDGRNIAEMYQGYFSSTNGNQYSLCGMPYATIASDLSGATITKVRLYLNNNHFYNNSGGTAVVGTHTYTSEPGSASLSNVNEDLARFSFAKGEAKWVTLPNSIGTAFKSGTARGISLGPGPSTSATYYGYFAGDGQSGEPILEITYTK